MGTPLLMVRSLVSDDGYTTTNGSVVGIRRWVHHYLWFGRWYPTMGTPLLMVRPRVSNDGYTSTNGSAGVSDDGYTCPVLASLLRKRLIRNMTLKWKKTDSNLTHSLVQNLTEKDCRSHAIDGIGIALFLCHFSLLSNNVLKEKNYL